MSSSRPENPKKIVIGIIGLGNVGSAFIDLLKTHFKELDTEIEIARIAVRDKSKPRKIEIDPAKITDDAWQVVDDPTIKVVIELAGGVDKLPYIKRAIESGKHVITANKALIAAHGAEILTAAVEKNKFVGYEASCAGAIPIVKFLRERYAMNSIYSFRGILNATTNFILDKMESEDLSYTEALAKAQESGFAEADPSLDVEGHDAAQKLQILASLAFKCPVPASAISTRGISQLSDTDMRMLKRCGVCIKLLAEATQSSAGICLSVRPVALPRNTSCARVHEAQNYIELEDTLASTLSFTGMGAGGKATATAVLQDLLDICREPSSIVIKTQACGFNSDGRTISYLSVDSVPGNYCVRITLNHDINLDNIADFSCFILRCGEAISSFSFDSTIYLCVNDITYKKLAALFDKAKAQGLIHSYYVIAVDPDAYALINKQRQSRIVSSEDSLSLSSSTASICSVLGGSAATPSTAITPFASKTSTPTIMRSQTITKGNDSAASTPIPSTSPQLPTRQPPSKHRRFSA